MRDYVTRRGLLAAGLAGTAAACTPKDSGQKSAVLQSAKPATHGVFLYGVASGDPSTRAVIIWTHVSVDNSDFALVSWSVARDAAFTDIVASGQSRTSKTRDWTVKVDARGLEPGQQYYYRFALGDILSPVGLTKTLPEGPVDKLRFAIVSCANWQHGYFNAYDHIGRQDHFDALLHLGDYYYEYGAGYYSNAAMVEAGRVHEPPHEIVTLDDYRGRHRQYRSDGALQSATLKMPLITIWDDHETSNDSWATGAQNHNDGEGLWDDRRAAAMRAYYEWMPIREPAPGRLRESIFRAYQFGDLLTLITLETRLLARDEPIIIDDYFAELRKDGAERFRREVMQDPERDMLGAAQLDFIATRLKHSKAAGVPWRLIANQVIMGRLSTPDMTPYVDETSMANIEKAWAGVRDFVELSKYALPVYPDSWDGYPVAREKLYTRLKAEGVTDMLVVTGDAHEFWVNDLTNAAGEKMGVELGTTSISSETLQAFMGDAVNDYALLMTQSNADVRYYNALYNGYIDLEIGRKTAKARCIAVDTVKSQSYSAFEAAAFTVRQDKGSLKTVSPKGLNLKQRALFAGLG